MNAASPHRVGVTVLVATAAVLVIAALSAGSGYLERIVEKPGRDVEISMYRPNW